MCGCGNTQKTLLSQLLNELLQEILHAFFIRNISDPDRAPCLRVPILFIVGRIGLRISFIINHIIFNISLLNKMKRRNAIKKFLEAKFLGGRGTFDFSANSGGARAPPPCPPLASGLNESSTIFLQLNFF